MTKISTDIMVIIKTLKLLQHTQSSNAYKQSVLPLFLALYYAASFPVELSAAARVVAESGTARGVRFIVFNPLNLN